MTKTIEKALTYLGEQAGRTGTWVSQGTKGRSEIRTVEGHVKLRAPKVSSGAVGRLAEKLDVSEVVILNVSDISERTFQRRRKSEEDLTEAESDRLLRIARVASEAERVFGDGAKSRRWLSSDNRLLGAKPLDLLATDFGAREVEFELVRIDFGDFA